MSNLLYQQKKGSLSGQANTVKASRWLKNYPSKKNYQIQNLMTNSEPGGKEILYSYIIQKNNQTIDQNELSNQLTSINLCLTNKKMKSVPKKSSIKINKPYLLNKQKKNQFTSTKIKQSTLLSQNQCYESSSHRAFFMTSFDPSSHLNKTNGWQATQKKKRYSFNQIKNKSVIQDTRDSRKLFCPKSNYGTRVKSSIHRRERVQKQCLDQQYHQLSPLKNKILSEKIASHQMQSRKNSNREVATISDPIQEKKQLFAMKVKKCVYHFPRKYEKLSNNPEDRKNQKKNIFIHQKTTQNNRQYLYKFQDIMQSEQRGRNKSKPITNSLMKYFPQPDDIEEDQFYLKTLN